MADGLRFLCLNGNRYLRFQGETERSTKTFVRPGLVRRPRRTRC
jgi:hypothetical protein